MSAMAVISAVASKDVSAIHPSLASSVRPQYFQTNPNSTVRIQVPKRSSGNLRRTGYSTKTVRILRIAAGVDIPAGPEPLEKNEKETSRVASSPNGGLDNEFVPTAVTWQPVSRSVNDGYQGWSSPIELDNIRTDISINAGLPEWTAALGLAICVAVVAFAATQRKDFQQVSFDRRVFEAPYDRAPATEAEKTKAPVPAEKQNPTEENIAAEHNTPTDQNTAASEQQASTELVNTVPSDVGEEDIAKEEVSGGEETGFDEEPSLFSGKLQMASAATALGVEKLSENREATNETASKQPSQLAEAEVAESEDAEEVFTETESKQHSFSDQEKRSGKGTQGPSVSPDEAGGFRDKDEAKPGEAEEEQELSFSMLMPWAEALNGDTEAAEETASSSVQVADLDNKENKQDLPVLQDTKQAEKLLGAGEGEVEETTEGRPYIASPPAPVTAAGLPDSQVPRAGRVVVQPVIDASHVHAVEALQALRVVEEDVEPGSICTRRQYARWILTASSVLSRHPSERIFPSMCLEDLTELAFDDVLPGDPDFAAIQGLAEAGLISSNLSRKDLLCDRNVGQSGCSARDTGPKFRPDGPLSRQDLISWKVALENRSLAKPDIAAMRKVGTFIDVDRIDRDALPAIAADMSAGDRSLITAAFGFTRRFEPSKPVTCAQAAVTLALGRSAEIVGEELARMEAEKVAVAAWEAAEALEKEELERERRVAQEACRVRDEEKGKLEEVRGRIEEAELRLEKIKEEREEEKERMLQAKADLEAEMKRVAGMKEETEKIVSEIESTKQSVAAERERLERLQATVTAEREATAAAKAELEGEKQALALARSVAEEEVKRARDEFRRLEIAEARLEQEKKIEAKTEEGVSKTDLVALPRWEAAPEEEGALKKEEGFFGDWNAEELMAKGEKLRRDTNNAVGEVMGKAAETVSGAVGKAGEVVAEAVEKAGSAISGGGKKEGEGGQGMQVGGEITSEKGVSDQGVEKVVWDGERNWNETREAVGGAFKKMGVDIGGVMAKTGDAVNGRLVKAGEGWGGVLEKTGEVWEQTKSESQQKISEVAEGMQSGIAGLAGAAEENAKKFTEVFKEEATKLAARFKSA